MFQPFDDDEHRSHRSRSPTNLTPIIERKNKDTVLSFEDELFRRKWTCVHCVIEISSLLLKIIWTSRRYYLHTLHNLHSMQTQGVLEYRTGNPEPMKGIIIIFLNRFHWYSFVSVYASLLLLFNNTRSNVFWSI